MLDFMVPQEGIEPPTPSLRITPYTPFIALAPPLESINFSCLAELAAYTHTVRKMPTARMLISQRKLVVDMAGRLCAPGSLDIRFRAVIAARCPKTIIVFALI